MIRIGQKIGQLTVLEEIGETKIAKAVRKIYRCSCSCGNEINLLDRRLKKTRSCGCRNLGSRRDDKTGKRFGRLTALERYEFDPDRWLCRCDCGNDTIVCTNHLDRGSTKSCGCFKNARMINLNFSFENLYDQYKRAAKKTNRDFLLEKAQFKEIVDGNCYYCNSPPERLHLPWGPKNVPKDGGYICNGIDRRDNTAGYTLDNSVSCCFDCNSSKLDYTEEEFSNWIKNIARRQGWINDK